jgi:hypothetical protein
MRTWCVPLLTAAVFGLTLTGCGSPQRGSDEPMPTDGPNQVVIKVPGMT